jgi:hypothetical protein
VRFCPFCSAENADELAVCQSCGRRLPPLPPRRARNAPPTGVQLPPRGNSNNSSGALPAHPPARRAPVAGDSQSQPLRPDAALSPTDSLIHAITPGPAAARREAPPTTSGDPTLQRRTGDRVNIPSLVERSRGQVAFDDRPTIPQLDPPSELPPRRDKPPSMPPPIPPQRAASPPPTTSTAPGMAAMPAHRPSMDLPPPGPHAVPRALTPPPLPSYPSIPAVSSPAKAALPDEVEIAALHARGGGNLGDPPPTRIQRAESHADRPFTPPKVTPVPEVPEPSLVNAARYALRFARARWQRRGAIKVLGAEIKQDTEALDQVLGALGREARNSHVEGRVFSAENGAISAAEERIAALGREHGEVDSRKLEENSKFIDVEAERNTKLGEAGRNVDEAQKELTQLETQRRQLRDRRKEVERRQKAYLRNAEENDRQAGSQTLGEQRQELRRSAEGFRKEAAVLEPERQDMDRRLAGLERPIGEATARLDAAKAELDAAKRSLNDAREGHTHRLAELDAEQKRKARDIATAESEIQRRLVTLGTLVNLNRVEAASFAELYQRIDRIRGAITARTTEIEKLTAERDAYDRGVLVRGVSAIGGAIVLLIAFIVILRAIAF